jgi:hypothetical protein
MDERSDWSINMYENLQFIKMYSIILFINLLSSISTESSYTYKYNLPEYSEYKKIIESVRPNTTTESTTISTPRIIYSNPQFVPDLPLCKETPENNNVYGHAYCLIAFLFYLVAIVSALLFTCRAFGCLKRFENGHTANNKHSPIKSADMPIV